MNNWRKGDMVRASLRTEGVVSYGTFRVTAVRGMRCYVDHVEGAKYCRGIKGWTNLWFYADDERVERV